MAKHCLPWQLSSLGCYLLLTHLSPHPLSETCFVILTLYLPAIVLLDSERANTSKDLGRDCPSWGISPAEEEGVATWSEGGSHLSNSPIQFWRVFTGTTHRMQEEEVWRKNTSTKPITCRRGFTNEPDEACHPFQQAEASDAALGQLNPRTKLYHNSMYLCI